MSGQPIVGANLKLYINNRPFGIATNIEWTRQDQHKAVYGIDSIVPYELLPQTTSINGKVSFTAIKRDGGLIGRSIVARTTEILREKYISIVLVDRDSGFIILRVDQCIVTTQSYKADAKGILRGVFSFEGIESSTGVDI